MIIGRSYIKGSFVGLVTGLNNLFTNLTKICVLCGFLFLSSSAWADLKFHWGDMADQILDEMVRRLDQIGDIEGVRSINQARNLHQIGGQIMRTLIGPAQNPLPRQIVGTQGSPGGNSISPATTEMSGGVVSNNQYLKRFNLVSIGEITFSRTADGGQRTTMYVNYWSKYELVDPSTLSH